MKSKIHSQSLGKITQLKSKFINLYETIEDEIEKEQIEYFINLLDWIIVGKICLDANIFQAMLEELVITSFYAKDLQILELLSFLKQLGEVNSVKV